MGAPVKGGELARARACYARRQWGEAHRSFGMADGKGLLSADDLERYAVSAALLGRDDEHLALLDWLYQLQLGAGERRGAARAAFWLGFRLASLKEVGQASGWLARAQRLIEDDDCVEKGYLLLPTVYRLMAAGDDAGAGAAAETAAAIGDRFGDPDLSAFARCQQGRVLLKLGEVDRGLSLLDEAMIAVTGGALSPVLTGLIYCTAIGCCNQLYVMDRAREWTEALARWCSAQPDLVPFSGTCLVHRAELMQLGGAWPEAIDEARRASERASRKVDWAANADAHYQQAEVHRLRGEFPAAERSYRSASELGREAQPGLALLRLCQGRAADACSAIRGALQSARDRLDRARLLPAAVEIALAAGDVEAARGYASELATIAGQLGTEVLGGMAALARGAVALASGQPEAALEPLRHGFRVWHDAGAPYIAARVRVLIAAACQALGDRDTAALERDCARAVFQRLGAEPDLRALDAGPTIPRAVPAGLSRRELEVLRLVAAGQTNKSIARQLFLSEKTIDRHVSNIFAKTNVASRAAATAFAYQHGLV